jgi:glycine cleavage system regulatory protein
MQIPLVMTVIGRDRPGLVESVARMVADHGGNWLESRMCRLGGEFAGILRVHLPSEREQPLRLALAALQAQGLTVVVQADRADAPTPAPAALIELVGHDRPGIVRDISAVLAAQSVNVEELHTECASAPMSGEALFKAEARLHLPPTCDVVRLRRDLERIAADLQVDITFEELKI